MQLEGGSGGMTLSNSSGSKEKNLDQKVQCASITCDILFIYLFLHIRKSWILCWMRSVADTSAARSKS